MSVDSMIWITLAPVTENAKAPAETWETWTDDHLEAEQGIHSFADGEEPPRYQRDLNRPRCAVVRCRDADEKDRLLRTLRNPRCRLLASKRCTATDYKERPVSDEENHGGGGATGSSAASSSRGAKTKREAAAEAGGSGDTKKSKKAPKADKNVAGQVEDAVVQEGKEKASSSSSRKAGEELPENEKMNKGEHGEGSQKSVPLQSVDSLLDLSQKHAKVKLAELLGVDVGNLKLEGWDRREELIIARILRNAFPASDAPVIKQRISERSEEELRKVSSLIGQLDDLAAESPEADRVREECEKVRQNVEKFLRVRGRYAEKEGKADLVQGSAEQ
ncbi:unnamed protein product [Amoebophrya sp. A120]|nr:unnamed protein product [Amoebophrya sp. A120]|eukprot:GSA120T00022546001.1